MKKSDIPVVISLNREEVDALKSFCDDNLAVGTVKISQKSTGIGYVTRVMVTDLPETLTDITDYSAW